jgi:hypothetical protein
MGRERLRFGIEQSWSGSDLAAALAPLATSCRSAATVLLLANLGDFLGEGNEERRAENEWVLKHAMDELGANGKSKRFALVFTQADLYDGVCLRHDGWVDVGRRYLPLVHGAHLGREKVPVFPVAAVGATRVHVDEAGIPCLVPKHGFGSDGLDMLMGWIVEPRRDWLRRLIFK